MQPPHRGADDAGLVVRGDGDGEAQGRRRCAYGRAFGLAGSAWLACDQQEIVVGQAPGDEQGDEQGDDLEKEQRRHD